MSFLEPESFAHAGTESAGHVLGFSLPPPNYFISDAWNMDLYVQENGTVGIPLADNNIIPGYPLGITWYAIVNDYSFGGGRPAGAVISSLTSGTYGELLPGGGFYGPAEQPCGITQSTAIGLPGIYSWTLAWTDWFALTFDQTQNDGQGGDGVSTFIDLECDFTFGICGLPPGVANGTLDTTQAVIYPSPPNKLNANLIQLGTPQGNPGPVQGQDRLQEITLQSGFFDTRPVFGNKLFTSWVNITKLGSMSPYAQYGGGGGGLYFTIQKTQDPQITIVSPPNDEPSGFEPPGTPIWSVHAAHPAGLSLTISAVGLYPIIKYQWQYLPPALYNASPWTDMHAAGFPGYSGFNTPTLNIESTSLDMLRSSYRCFVTESDGTYGSTNFSEPIVLVVT